jgi:hypothetical protein
MAVVGAFVANRRPDNATGWLFFGGGFLMVSNGFAKAYTNYALIVHHLPSAHLFAWLSFWTWMPAFGLIALVLVVFPTGRPLTAPWRWVVRAEVAVIGAVCLAALPTLAASSSSLLTAPSPDKLRGGSLLAAVGIPLQVFAFVGFVGLVVRFIRARGIERLQMKWFLFGASILALATLFQFGLVLFANVEDPISNPWAAGSIEVGAMAIPVTSGFAMLRYRLYDIDRIISRTLSYAVVTGLLIAAYVAFVVLFQAATRPLTGRSDLAIAASTLIVAALFVPLRRRVQNVVDRRFNRARYDAERTVEAFTTRLRDEIDIDALGAELTNVVGRTMQPSSVSLWLRDA